MEAATIERRFIEPWFNSQSLGADYGTYTCEICSREFYHSPSTVEKKDEVLHNCICGNCANKILAQDHGSTYFE